MSGKKLETIESVVAFMQAGNATVTLVSKVSGKRFTYKITESDDNPNLMFVGLMNGPDNEANYAYMGIISHGEFRRTAKSRISEDAPSYRGFKYLWNKLCQNVLPNDIEVWHEGRCGACGRKLTVPSSIESGIGPECQKKAKFACESILSAIGG